MSGAQAADMPDFLRGGFTEAPTRATVNWQGYYVGGQWGYGSSDKDLVAPLSTAPLLQALVANTIIEQEMGVSGSVDHQFRSCPAARQEGGAFAGYNSQWDDVVIGLER